MALQTRKRYQASMALTNGGKTTQKLSLGLAYRELALRLKGTATIGTPGTNNVPGNIVRGDEWSYLSKISLVANSSDVIREYSGSSLRMRNLISGLQNPNTLALGDGATGTVNIDSTIILPLWSVGSNKRPIDTALDSSRFSDLRLEVTTSNSSICTTSTTLGTNFTLDIHSYENDADPMKPSDPYGPGGAFTLRREVAATYNITQTDNRIDLLTGPLYAGFFINVQNTSGVDSSSVVSNIKLISGTTVFYDRPWAVAQNETYAYAFDGAIPRYAFDGAGASGAASYPNLFRNTKENLNGWVYVDLCNDGFFTESINTAQFGEFTLILTGIAAGTAEIIPVQLYPPRVSVAA